MQLHSFQTDRKIDLLLLANSLVSSRFEFVKTHFYVIDSFAFVARRLGKGRTSEYLPYCQCAFSKKYPWWKQHKNPFMPSNSLEVLVETEA